MASTPGFNRSVHCTVLHGSHRYDPSAAEDPPTAIVIDSSSIATVDIDPSAPTRSADRVEGSVMPVMAHGIRSSITWPEADQNVRLS